MVKEKYAQSLYGTCPRVLCERQNVLPIGLSEELSNSRVKVYCPKCQDVYVPKGKSLDIDGAYFG
jgi:casein kinase II subunit beta